LHGEREEREREAQRGGKGEDPHTLEKASEELAN